MKVSSYKELEAYKKAYKNVIGIYKLTKPFPKEEKYGIVSQIRRASVSIPLNIAEGYMKGSKEYVRFLRIALGSSAEVETLLTLCADLEFCTLKDINYLYSANLEVIKLLRYYINKLEDNIKTKRN